MNEHHFPGTDFRFNFQFGGGENEEALAFSGQTSGGGQSGWGTADNVAML
jgi:hypothetical protein